jgi:Tol biopolymer transport system component
MTIAAGTRLGSYEISSRLGEGGMGVVWRATDSQLGREVALKVLPEEFTADPERLARFEREARLLAALNHPNIAQIYGLETGGEERALVMELVEGPTLAERMAPGPLPLDDTLAVARQIAGALEAAHEKGIVHRDLKPQNVKLDAEECVKVLDFGLAKAMEDEPSSMGGATLAHSPTITHGATVAGVILGTAAYMSPEQARGLPVDSRADIWAFGVLLWEMLAGRPLFAAETVTDTLAGVLRNEIDWDALPPETPPAVRRLLRRCLARKAKERLHHIADVRIVLDEVLGGMSEEGAQPASFEAGSEERRGIHFFWPVAAALLGALAVATVDRTVLAPAPVDPPRLAPVTYSGSSAYPSISPDRRHIAFESNRSNRDGTSRIWVKQLATGEEVAITGIPSGAPRISPDGSSLFFAGFEQEGSSLFRVPLVGGSPRLLARGWTSFDADWSPDGRRIVLGRRGGPEGEHDEVTVIDADSGRPEVLATITDGAITTLAWSPDGQRIAFSVTGRANFAAIQRIDLFDFESQQVATVHRFPGGAVSQALDWDGDGALVYAWSHSQAGRGPFELERLDLATGRTRTLTTLQSLPDRIEIAGPGELVLDAPELHQSLVEVALGDSAAPRVLTSGPTVDRQPAFSPDGEWIVFSSDRSGSLDLWAIATDSGAVRRLTYDDADDWDPAFTPDGRHLLWSSNRSGNFEIWMADPEGGSARQVSSDGVDAENPAMTADGEWIVYSSANPASPGLWKVRPDGTEATRILAGNFTVPELSPRRGWVAVVDSDSLVQPTVEIHVVRIEDGSEVTRIGVPAAAIAANLTAGRSRWTGDGDVLVFVAGGEISQDVNLVRQTVVPGRDTDAERITLFAGDRDRVPESLAVSPDGRRLVVSVASGSSDVLRIEGLAGIGKSRR